MSGRRYAAVVAVAAMLVLAGCGAGGGGDGSSGDGGGPTATATVTPTPTPETVEYPAGLSEDGFENATLFLERHRGALTSGPSYAVRMDVTVGSETQTLRASTDPETERIRSQTERNGDLDYDIYYADGTQYVRQVNDGSGTYGTTDATFRSAAEGLNGGQFLTTVVLLNLSATGVTTENGQTVVTYEILGPRSTSEGIAEADGTVRVNAEGRLVAFEYDLVSTEGREVSVTWERTGVGETTVEEPDWLEQAQS
jgi:hypothetical protein